MLVWQPIQCQGVFAVVGTTQGKFIDNSTEANSLSQSLGWITMGPLQPYATIAITTPNGTHLFGEAKVDASQFNAGTQYNEHNDG